MEIRDYNRFIKDCIAVDPADDHGLTEDEMYGVYLSWCALHRRTPKPCKSFWTAMSELGLPEQYENNHRHTRPGLRMTGPAALDYILTSRPSLV